MRKKLVGDLDRVKQPSAVLGTRSGRADDRLREWGLGQVGEDVADAEGLQDAAVTGFDHAAHELQGVLFCLSGTAW